MNLIQYASLLYTDSRHVICESQTIGTSLFYGLLRSHDQFSNTIVKVKKITVKWDYKGFPSSTGRLCYAHCKRFVEDVILVSEEEIVQAMHELFERGLKVEPAGCAAMAAILNHRVPEVEGKDVLVIVSGGNVSVQELYQLLPK